MPKDDAHAKNLRREGGYISLSLAITLRPPFVSSDVETLRVHPRRDYKIALPPPREIFNLVYYRPPLPARKLCPRFSARENCSTNLYLPARDGEGWRNLPSPVRKKIYRSYAVSKAVEGTNGREILEVLRVFSILGEKEASKISVWLAPDGLDRACSWILKEYFYVIAVIII